MPSGAKKRKAAKKKMEKEAHLTSSTNNIDDHSRGNDNEKDSDGGEVNSPSAQDHHHHHHSCNEGSEEVEKSDPSSDRSFVAENKSMEGLPRDAEDSKEMGVKDDGVVKIERELKSDDDSESKNTSTEQEDSAKESHNGDGRSSSSSSSDNGSGVTEKKAKEGAYHSVSETTPFNDLVKPVDLLSEQESRVTERVPVGEVYNSNLENAHDVDFVKPMVSVSNEMVHVVEIAPVENSVVSSVVESRLKENGKKLLTKLNVVPGVSVDTVDMASNNIENKVFPFSDENAGASLSLVESASKENEGKVLPSLGAFCAETSNGAEHDKHSEISGCSEDQPLVASGPRPVQKTSWKSCCGLFEVLTGSK